MLVGFSIKNFKSFFDEINFSMIAGIGIEYEETNIFLNDKERYLKSALMYGANASGKSNLIDGLKLMKEIMSSDFSEQIALLSKCTPFLFSEESDKKPVEFEITFKTNNTFYTYGFHVLDKVISKEYLYRKTERISLLFERTSCNFKDVIIKNKSAFKGMSNLLEQLRDDVLFIKFAYMFNNEIAKEVVDYFKLINYYGESKFSYNLIKPGEELNKKALKILKYADKTISNVILQTNEHNQRPKLLLEREFYSNSWEKIKAVKIDFDEFSSKGSRHLYRLLQNILYVLEYGGVFIVDEIHTHLHPLLTRKIIEMFHSTEYNPNNAQLISTVHDVFLLEGDIRRDQIWFIEKDTFGKSSLYSLADFKNVRKNDNKLKKYLLGVYGAIPEIFDID